MCGATCDVRFGPKADVEVSDQRRNVALAAKHHTQPLLKDVLDEHVTCPVCCLSNFYFTPLASPC